MAQPFETFEVTAHRIACDGGAKDKNDPLGHPRVYLEIDEEEGKVVCPYCSRTYVYAHSSGGADAA